ncbi:OmpP1/FadL family transporter [Helicobacter cholecystus]|uniref:OmpP1/FadL family transporter n=1 Tax=Helicobacter cholecystus TaxID=45498 RepID=UPI0027398639|nr:outer membrane protein transport protein [Helicobacter cholecystus]
MKKVFSSVLMGSVAFAGGFKMNEHSLNSIALSSAYVAGASGADSAYYNPANMGMGRFSDKHELEISTTWIHVPAFDFTTDFTKIKNQTGRDQGTQVTCQPVKGADGWFGSITCSLVGAFAPQVEAGPTSARGHANATNFVYPEIFYKSPTFWGGFNIGLAVTAPSGMTMDWDGVGGEFLDSSFIAMIEANPSISFKIGEWFGVGAGGRFVYGLGKFANTLNVPYVATMMQGLPGSHAIVTTNGTSTVDQVSSTKGKGFGYNIALTLKPLAFWTDSLIISATYRSPVHIDFKGRLSAVAITGKREDPIVKANMDADLLLSTDIPPVLQIGIAQRLGSFLIEAVYERNFWSYGDKFEFQYQNQKFSNIGGSMANQMGSTDEQRAKFMENMMSGADYDAVAIGRGWKDTSSYRVGVTYDVTQKFKAMASFAYDQSPVPKDAFGIPDADGYMMGVGVRYSMFKDTLDLGAAYSMTFKDNRESYIQSDSGLGKLQLVNVSMACRF